MEALLAERGSGAVGTATLPTIPDLSIAPTPRIPGADIQHRYNGDTKTRPGAHNMPKLPGAPAPRPTDHCAGIFASAAAHSGPGSEISHQGRVGGSSGYTRAVAQEH